MAQVDAMQVRPGSARISWRVRFAYRDDDIRPVSATRVAMVALGSAGSPGGWEGKASGAWIEVVDSERGRCWARSIRQPNRPDREVFLENGECTHVAREVVEGEFELILPDFGPNAVFVLHTSPAAAPEKAAAPRVKLERTELVRLEEAGPQPPEPVPSPIARTGGRKPKTSGGA